MQTLSLESVRGCPHCGLFTTLPAAPAGSHIDCPRCDRTLSRPRQLSMDHALAYAVAGLMFCLVLMSAPFLDVMLYGRHQTSTLILGPERLDQEQLWPVGLVVFLTTLLLPTLKMAFTVIVLVGLRMKNPPSVIVTLYRWVRRISPWAMLEVFLLGFLVAYTRLQTMTYIQIDTAVYALVGAMLCIAATDTILNKEEVWCTMRERGLGDDLGDAPYPLVSCRTCFQASRLPVGSLCPRCQTPLHPRKIGCLQRAWAFMLAAAILYVPANYFPVMIITKLGHSTPYTITGGMLELNASGLWPLAILVFIASIAIPLLKMLALGYLLVMTHRGSGEHLKRRTKLYRVIDFIGRWSMVDIFMISILVALMNFGQFAQIEASRGALFFAAVVILTMLAVESFDARLMWDSAGQNPPLKEFARE